MGDGGGYGYTCSLWEHTFFIFKLIIIYIIIVSQNSANPQNLQRTKFIKQLLYRKVMLAFTSLVANYSQSHYSQSHYSQSFSQFL